ncbi:PAS domain S-box protein [Spirosoma sp. SC4-14]|uniref:PAS domain S-box protein n=1 Tax=Spirosoma sp. SC4-14 TaxID=3128900 RepID=UPI0030CC7BD3
MAGSTKSVEEELLAVKAELQRIKQQTSQALQAVGIGLWTMFPHQNRILWDEQCQRIYAWSEASIRLDEFLARIHPQDLPHLRYAMSNPPSRHTGKPTVIDYRISSPSDETIRWIRITGRATISQSEESFYFSGTAQDVTDEKNKEATLKTVEQQFQTAFTNAAVGVVILDTQSNVKLINTAFAEFVGYSQEELFDKHFRTISHPDDIDENVGLVNQLLRGESTSYVFNKRYLRKDGSIVWGQVSSALVRDQDGNPDSFISIVQDVTAQVKAQADQKQLLALLRASEERLREAIELAELGTFEINLSDKALLLSERAKEWLGFSAQEPIDLQQLVDLVQNRDEVKQALERVVSTTINTTLILECRIQHRQTGQERLYQTLSRIVRDNTDRKKLLLRGIARDITAQREYAQELEQQVQVRTLALQKANARIEQQADQLRFVTDNALTAIALYSIVRDPDTGSVVDLRYELINRMAQQMTGRQAHELLGRTTLEVFPGMVNNKVWDQYLKLAETGMPLRYHNHYTQDGYDIWYEVQGVRQNEFLVMSFLDITELKQTQFKLESLNKDLREANHNLQQFAFIASHDLQEPLRKIQSFGTLLQEQYADQLEQGADLIHRMQLAAERMSTLIKDLLAFSRITTHQQLTVNVPLKRVIDQVIDNLEIAISEAQATITIDSLPTVKGDESQFRQLFQNLLSNALKFRRPNISTQIHIHTQQLTFAELPPGLSAASQANSYYLVSIKDNGIGFDEKYLDRIFQVFQRLHSRNQYVGTGIGLAIVQKIVTNHSGIITATSKPNEGSTFQIYLPADV